VITIFTIGFTKKTAEEFFSALKTAGARKLLDIRLNNVSQLCGFTKRNDLAYFTREICGIEYRHLLDLAPTQELLDEYKKKGAGWPLYQERFLDLMSRRRIEEIDTRMIDGGCLLCSEERPAHCHRRLVAEYLREKWGELEIVHL